MPPGENVDGRDPLGLSKIANQQEALKKQPPKTQEPDVPTLNKSVPSEWTSAEENQRVKAPGLLEVVRKNLELEERLNTPQQPKKTLGLTEAEILETLKDQKDQQIGSEKPTKFRQNPKSK